MSIMMNRWNAHERRTRFNIFNQNLPLNSNFVGTFHLAPRSDMFRVAKPSYISDYLNYIDSAFKEYGVDSILDL